MAYEQFIFKQREFQTNFKYYKIQYNNNKSTNIERFRRSDPSLNNFRLNHFTKDIIPIQTISKDVEFTHACSKVIII